MPAELHRRRSRRCFGNGTRVPVFPPVPESAFISLRIFAVIPRGTCAAKESRHDRTGTSRAIRGRAGHLKGKHTNMQIIEKITRAAVLRQGASLLAACAIAMGAGPARAGIAYGTINNFDTVNDTGQTCHGFEIELDDCQSRNITYCYSYNHYGTPTIREDTTSVPGRTNVIVRYAAVRTNGVWSAYTAIPSGPIAPTDGHRFTNPGTNFGGEHFGVGYYGRPSAIKYNWLVDNGAGVLVHGPAVQVSTPAFTYYAPAVGAPAQVQAVIEAPREKVEPVEGFGPAVWVKSIITVSHTNRPIKLRELVSDDPDDPEKISWRNGEPDEVESEWDLLQHEYGGGGGGDGAGAGAANGGNGGAGGVIGQAEDLDDGDEIVTRRYEFYAYVGPTDPENGEALADNVGPDGIHGTMEYSNTVVVGEFLGAQMSAFDHELPIGLTEHVANGRVNTAYPTRAVVIAGVPFACTNTGALPAGMTFNRTTGELSGTPAQTGVFTFKVRASTTNQPAIERSYTFAITAANVVLPPHSTVDTVSHPLDTGDAGGTGLYTNGHNCTVTATPRRGYRFKGWEDNGKVVSTAASYTFPVNLNRSLVAKFAQAPPDVRLSRFNAHSHKIVWETNATGCVLEETSDVTSTNWTPVASPVSVVGTNAEVTLPTQTGVRFFRLRAP
jgi:hypothetical protein